VLIEPMRKIVLCDYVEDVTQPGARIDRLFARVAVVIDYLGCFREALRNSAALLALGGVMLPSMPRRSERFDKMVCGGGALGQDTSFFLLPNIASNARKVRGQPITPHICESPPLRPSASVAKRWWWLRATAAVSGCVVLATGLGAVGSRLY